MATSHWNYKRVPTRKLDPQIPILDNKENENTQKRAVSKRTTKEKHMIKKIDVPNLEPSW